MQFEATVHEVGDAWEWLELAYERGWTDGLPVAPPTEARVAAVLEYLAEDPQRVVGVIPPRQGVATLETIAINCVMAGCTPALVPVVIAALEAVLEPEFNLNGVQTTTNACAPLTIVAGPVVDALDFNASYGTFGGGSRASAAVGRALRLILWNLGGAKPGETALSTLGSPAKYCYCIAELEAASPWESLAVARGTAPGDSAVTVFACDPPHSVHVVGDAQRILNVLTQTLPVVGGNAFHCAGQYLLVVGPRPARELAGAGWTRSALQEYLWEHARYDLPALRERGLIDERDAVCNYWGTVPEALRRPALTSERAPMVLGPDDIHIVVAGGAGQWWIAYCPGWGNWGGFAVTRPLRWEG